MVLTSRQLVNLDWFSIFGVFRLQLTRMGVLMAIFIISLLVAWPTSHSIAAGQTIHAQSCTFSDVQAAVNSGATGAVINIPAGTCDWRANTLTVPGGVSLKGEGRAATIIRGSSGTGNLITIDCSNGKTSNFSNMALIGKANPAIWDGGLLLSGGCKDFMVFNSGFSDFVNFAISVYDDSRGVIFKNNFLNNFRDGQTGGATGYGVVVYGDSTWPLLELGTENAVFVEDNYFYGNRHNIASNNGSRYVFRYNNVTATGSVMNYAMVDAHGFASSPRGSRSWEVYNNTFSTKLPPGDWARTCMGMGGGDGVIFNNVLTNPDKISRTIELWAPRQALAYPAKDQMRSGYFWNNSPNTLVNNSPTHFVEGRDYFLYPKPEYRPYAYPHPLRQTLAATKLRAPSKLRVQ